MSARIQRPIPRRGFSRLEAVTYLGISPSKFDELRRAGRIGPAKVLDSRLIFPIERLDDFLDALPDEYESATAAAGNHDDRSEWTPRL